MKLKAILARLVITAIVVAELLILVSGWAIKFLTLSLVDWSGPLRTGGILCLSHLAFFGAFVLLVGFIRRSPIYLQWLNKGVLVALALGLTIVASYVTFQLYPGDEEKPDASQVLAQLGIYETNFTALPSCEQVRIYAYVSPYFKKWHSQPYAYPWMTRSIKNSGQVIAPCVIREAIEHRGKSAADTAEGAMERVKVMALHILLRELQDAYLSSRGGSGADLNFPEAQSYLDEVVCHAPRNSYELDATEAFYMSRFPDTPINVSPRASTLERLEKMTDLLCK